MPDRKGFWKQVFPVVLLTIVVAVCVSVLTFVNGLTEDKIEAQENEAVNTMLSEMFPEMSDKDFHDESGIYTIYADEVVTGYAFLSIGRGYGGNINILVGLIDENTVKGITIISQTETPGLGTRIAEPGFTEQFTGIAIGEVALAADGGRVDAITSSTISSRAVVDAVRDTALEKVKLLKELEAGG